MNLTIDIGGVISLGTVIGLGILVIRNNHSESGKRLILHKKIEKNEKAAEIKYVHKDVCTVSSAAMKKDLEEVKKKTDKIPYIQSGVNLLLQKNGLQLPKE